MNKKKDSNFKDLKTLAQVKEDYIRYVYSVTGFNAALTARILGVTNPTVVRTLKGN